MAIDLLTSRRYSISDLVKGFVPASSILSIIMAPLARCCWVNAPLPAFLNIFALMSSGNVSNFLRRRLLAASGWT
jgi:hypothetical protein